MTARVDLRPPAIRDLEAAYRWLADEGGIELAERFLNSANTSFARLLSTPGLGPPIESANLHLTAIRKWRVDGFGNFLIFYRPDDDGIAIIRVLHAAQDWWGLLDLP